MAGAKGHESSSGSAVQASDGSVQLISWAFLAKLFPHYPPALSHPKMPDVDFWDDPPEQRAHPPPSDGTPRVVLAPVDDSDHAARAVAWACQHLLRGGPDGDTLHLLHVVPAVHASTAMAYGGPMVMLEDLSIFAQSIYAVTTPHATPAIHARIRPLKLFFGFSRTARRGFFSELLGSTWTPD